MSVRRHLIVRMAAIAALALAGAAAVPPSATAKGATGWVVRPLCATPRAGHMSCQALRLVPGRAFDSASGGRRYSVKRPSGGGGPAGGYSPHRLALGYGVDPNAKAAATQTVAIVDAFRDPTVRSDLAAFDRHYHLPKETAQSFRVVNQRGKTAPLPRADEGWAGEIGLDVQAVRGICHKCKILLIETDSDSDASLAAGVNRAATMGATEITNSYGGPETDPENTTKVVQAYDHPGVVVTASTGDSGWYDWDNVNDDFLPANTPEIPAAYPSVVGVGGTSLFVNAAGQREGEHVWNDDGPADVDGAAAHEALGAAGGGCSTLYRARGWQRNVRDYVGLGCGARRSSVDIAAVADPVTGYDVFQTYPQRTGSWQTTGGTSLASPLIAAMWALAGGSGGVAYPALSLYGHFAADVHHHTHDVVRGGNGLCGSASVKSCTDTWGANPNKTEGGLVDCAFPATAARVLANRYQCYARTGYDGVSGVGTPAGLRAFTALGPVAGIRKIGRVHAGVRKLFTAVGHSPFPGGRIVRYVWHWGDGKVTRTTHASVHHRYRWAQRYQITVKVVDNYHRSGTATRNVRVRF